MLLKEPSTKKQPTRKKPTNNLRIFDLVHNETQEREVRKAATGKAGSRQTIKGKKIDNKTMLSLFRQHIGSYPATQADDYPLALKHSRETYDPFINNTTLSITKSNADIESQGRRPGSSVPFPHRETRRKQSFSICTNEHCQHERQSHSKSQSTHKALESRIGESDKQNKLSQGRYSLIDRTRKRQMHNRSCNDEQLLRKSSKSRTPASRSKVLERKKNNISCMEHFDERHPSGEKVKKKRRASAALLSRPAAAHPKPTKKETKKVKSKKAAGDNQKQRKSNQKDKSRSKERQRQRPLKSSAGAFRKKSLNVQRESEDDEYDYPVSKYINTKKKKGTFEPSSSSSKGYFLTSELSKKIFTESSLIRSSLQTSNKTSYEIDRNAYGEFQRITELEEEGTSIKKKIRESPVPDRPQSSESEEFDMREVREFQRRRQEDILHKHRLRMKLYESIEEEYPELSQEEVEFLASVIFIQRMWRDIAKRRRSSSVVRINNISDRAGKEDKHSKDSEHKLRQDQYKAVRLESTPEAKQYDSAGPNNLVYGSPAQKIADRNEDSNASQHSCQDAACNPLEKYKNYFDNLESSQAQLQQFSAPTGALHARPIFFKQIKRAANFIADTPNSSQSVSRNLPKCQKPGQPPILHSNEKEYPSMTERSEYSSVNCQREIFPPLEMINEHKRLLLAEFNERIASLQQQYVQQELDTRRYKAARDELEDRMKKELSEMKSSNKDIQKGYLKYIDFLKKIQLESREKETSLRRRRGKQTSKGSSKFLLRRVSSEDSLMGHLYSRFCTIQSISSDSNSLKELKQRLLVRKDHPRKHEDERDLAILTLRRNLSRQELLTNDKYMLDSRSPRNIPLDLSEKIKIDEGESFERYEQANDESDNRIKIKELDEGHYIREIRDTINDLHDSSSVSFEQNQDNIIPEFTLPDEQSLPIVSLKHEDRPKKKDSVISINDFLHRVKEDSFGVPTWSGPESPSYRIDDMLRKEENSILLSNQLLELLISEFYEEVWSCRQLQKKLKQRMDIRRRRLPTINCDVGSVLAYANSLFQFIADSQYREEVLLNFNTALGYAPYHFLKMLRDPDFVPPEEYVQIIPDSVYIQLEEVLMARVATENIDVHYQKMQPKFQNFLRGIRSVHNRAVFETVKIELLRLKPFGEEGMPYPWDPEPLFLKRTIDFSCLQQKFERVRQRLNHFCGARCGLLLEKYTVKTAEELQRVHEDSEERLLEVIEEEVREQSTWDFVNMQLLEVKMDLDTELFSQLIGELIDELAAVKLRRASPIE